MDLFTTMADVSGGEIPQDRPIDGKNILPLLKSEANAKSPHKAVYGFRPRGGVESVRYQDWKLIMPKGKTEVQLYDLTTDIGEKNNVASQHPRIVKQMVDMGNKAEQAVKNSVAIDK